MVIEHNLLTIYNNHQSGSFLSPVFHKFQYYLVQVFRVVGRRMKYLLDPRTSAALFLNSANENFSSEGYVYSLTLLFHSVILKIELYTPKLVYLIIQDPSIEIDGLKKSDCLDVVILNSSVSWGFVGVCLIEVSQFMVFESNKSSVPFWG